MPMISGIRRALGASVCAVVLIGYSTAQEGTVVVDTTKVDSAKVDTAKEEKPKFKAYDEVVTDKAETRAGVFGTHLVKEKLYYEIPQRELGRLFLWVTQIAENQTGKGFGGQAVNNQVVRWERRADRILLRRIQYESVADPSLAVYHAVSAATFPPILAAFDIETFGEDSSLVIDVTGFFTSDTPEFSPKSVIKGKKLDKKRSFIERVRAFPKNIETRAILTYEADKAGSRRLGTVSVVVHHSMVHLPAQPLMPRLKDSRVGFFSVSQTDYGIDVHRAERRSFVTRWRLVKKDPRKKLSEPVKPIVFYVDRSVPEKWKKYIAQGIEDWQEAFEQAGFKKAIIAKMAPSVEEDPDWSTEDARVASISWLPSRVENAFGPHVHDPRTGEILDADIKFYHNVMNLLRDWYFVQVAPLDDRAKKLPLPDDLMGELLRYVSAHEVGHSLGLPHNMKASSSYTVEQLRDARFTARNGNEASIMDYGRFNYVAQPGDRARLIPKIGSYDRFSIEWGYKQIPGAKTPDDELKALNEIVKRQDYDHTLRFGGRSRFDPTAQAEDLGSDPVAATRNGLLNIDRTVDMLIPATAWEGKDYGHLKELYGRLIGQRARELMHVANVIGGVEQVTKHVGQSGPVYQPLPRARGVEAMSFLLKHAFQTPTQLLKPEILTKIQASGNVSLVMRGQSRILRNLLSDERANRMVDLETMDSSAYTLHPS
ncbi:TPA: zinc-dependent metalloprotease, partial [Candidatus Latescibacteria bacterium]|nr:zinc-dependent metalloprotease [Candidatus Latescibacterota bacterium]